MKVKPCPKGKPVIVVPVGMSGSDLKEVKKFDHEAYFKMIKKAFRPPVVL